MRENRPWGYYQILEESEISKTKIIYVDSKQKLSYQRHQKRHEHWFIISGNPLVTINGQTRIMSPGQSVDIKAGDLHRIESQGKAVQFIEVQTGTYFGEDDIERIEDDYGRV
jgi:mannose-6-phosphate isomerase